MLPTIPKTRKPGTMMHPARSALLLIDFQTRLMPAIHDPAPLVANAARLLQIATLLGIPILRTEQNPAGLGPTLPELAGPAFPKMTFDATATEATLAALPDRPDLVVAGCEAHVCVLQTILGLRALGRQVYPVEDAIGARTPASKSAALARMARHGADPVTTEMVAFEWLQSAAHPHFRNILALIK